MKTIATARAESTCQKRVTVCVIYDVDDDVLACESNRCDPTEGALGVSEPSPDEAVQAIDDAREPLCLICRASFRLPRLSLCSACLHDNQDAEPSSDAQHGHAA